MEVLREEGEEGEGGREGGREGGERRGEERRRKGEE